MLVVVGTDITHVVCRQQICIFNNSFACLLWLASNKKSKYPGLYMCYSDETWWVVVGTSNIDPLGLSSLPMHIINIWFAHFFWLANDNKGKYLEGCIVGGVKKQKFLIYFLDSYKNLPTHETNNL